MSACWRVGLRTTDEEMVAAGNGYCRGGLGCGYVAVTRAASGGDGLCGCAEEEHRVMAAVAKDGWQRRLVIGVGCGCDEKGRWLATTAGKRLGIAGGRRNDSVGSSSW
ncbi:hypothetical protein B296_00050054 [Ensete ventricosum]|uniref:Uncharacterized protein n=1 Tax=Ensete ventricosum TaxID=4639 RepID=A0A426X7W0_ENSVE|nr:hypothetical protein B296_00050054 [Ensete ventricosum]